MTPFKFIQNTAEVPFAAPTSVQAFAICVASGEPGQAVSLSSLATVPQVGCGWQINGQSLVNSIGALALAVDGGLQTVSAQLSPSDPSQQWQQTPGVTSQDAAANGQSVVGSTFASLDNPVVSAKQEAFLTLYNAANVQEPELVVNLAPGTTEFDCTSVWTLATPGGPSMPQVILDNESDKALYLFFDAKLGTVDSVTPQPVPLAAHSQSLVVPQWVQGLNLQIALQTAPVPGEAAVAKFAVVQTDAIGTTGNLHLQDVAICVGWRLKQDIFLSETGYPIIHVRLARH